MRARPSVKLRQLQYFLAVAETLHFSKAADSLFVTQPTLSHQLAELEAQLGARLFNRAGKAVTLTQAGALLRGYAKRGIDEIEAGYQALMELEGLARGELRIGVSQSFIPTLLPPILGEFMRRYPAIQLRAEEMTAHRIEQLLSEGSIDLGIAFAPAVMEDTELEPLFEERLLLVSGPGHALAERAEMPIAELAGVPLALLGRGFSTRLLIERYFEAAGARPNVVCETNSISLMLGLARQSVVAAIIPQSAIDAASGLSVTALRDPVPMRVSALLWSRHHYRALVATAFAELLRSHLKSIPEIPALVELAPPSA